MDILDKKIENPKTHRQIKLSSALQHDKADSVYKIAKNIIDKGKKEKKPKKEPSVFIKKYGNLKLNAFPSEDVKEEDVKVNMEGDIHSHAVLTWRDPKTGRAVNSYTQKFMKRNAKIKWARIKKLNSQKVESIIKESNDKLDSDDPEVSDSAAIISIIAQTGLRIGDHTNYNRTKNRGVMTLGPENIKIEDNIIKLNFVGKSYKENNASIKDEKLANYLQKRLNENKDKNFIFDTGYNEVNDLFDKFAGDKFKIKDLRTYTATTMAKDILLKDKTPPPPLPENDKQIKKAIKKKLLSVFEQVSQRLNNTPAMAKSSYVHPEIINKWLATLGVREELTKEVYSEGKIFVNLLTEEKKSSTFKVTSDFEDCDEYQLPKWWNDENVKLIKK